MVVEPLPPVRNTFTGVVSAFAECDDCGWSYENHKNGLALGNQHARRTGHTVRIEQVTAVTYNRKASDR